MAFELDRRQFESIAEETRAVFNYSPLLSTSIMPGEWKSPHGGDGSEFDGYREYQPGDDLRKIHPQMTSRQRGNTPILIEHIEKREIRLLLVADLSLSMYLRDKPFMLYAAIKMLMSWAQKEYIPVGFWGVSEDHEIKFKPKQGKRQLKRIDDSIVSVFCEGFDPENNPLVLTRKGSKPNIGWFKKFLPVGSAIFVLSDFLGRDNPLRDVLETRLAGYKTVPIVVQDDLEYTFPDLPSSGADVPLFDPETQNTERVWLDAQKAKAIRARHERRFSKLRNLFEEKFISSAHISELDTEDIHSRIDRALL